MLTDAVVSDDKARASVPPRGLLDKYIKYCSTQTDAPLCFHVGAGLTLLANLIPSQLYLDKNGKKTKFNLYTLLIGDSVLGRKTTSMDLALSVLQPVVPERLIPGQPDSWQGLLRMLGETPGGQALVCEGEFSRFLSQAGNGGYLLGLKQGYVEIYDGNTVGKHTKAAEESVVIQSPSVSLLAGCAPVFIEEYMTRTDFEGGFWARFLVMNADSGEYKPYAEPRLDMLERLRDIARQYTARVPPLWESMSVVISPEAKARIGAWGTNTVEFARKLDPSDLRRGVVARSQLIVIKVAALLAYDRSMELLIGGDKRLANKPLTILPEDVEWAEKVAEIHIISAVGVSRSVASTPAMRNRRRVLNLILAARGAVTIGHLTLEGKMLLRDINPILATLVAEGLISVSIAADGVERYMACATPEELERRRRASEAAPDILRNVPVPIGDSYDPGETIIDSMDEDGNVVFHH